MSGATSIEDSAKFTSKSGVGFGQFGVGDNSGNVGAPSEPACLSAGADCVMLGGGGGGDEVSAQLAGDNSGNVGAPSEPACLSAGADCVMLGGSGGGDKVSAQLAGDNSGNVGAPLEPAGNPGAGCVMLNVASRGVASLEPVHNSFSFHVDMDIDSWLPDMEMDGDVLVDEFIRSLV